MEGNQTLQLAQTVVPRDKREAVPTIRALINETETHLQEYDSQTEDIKLRSSAELLQARRKITDAVELSERFELTVIGERARELERQTLDALTFWGGIDTHQVLPTGSPADVRDEVWRRLDDLATDGGYVLASVHDIQAEVPPENVHAMFTAADDWRANNNGS